MYDDNGKYRLPNLSQINVDGIKSLRNILGDVVLDVLLYYEPHYIHQVFDVVVEELNRVCTLYKERNPHFNGKIHIMGHSLGSAIAFDLMSLQYNEIKDEPDLSKDLTFDVDSLFCVGSPVGVFKLLAQHNIASRSSLPAEFNPRSLSNTQSSPKCQNLYNIFHPCDPVGYRMEPLVSPRFSNFKPESVPFAVKGFNTQIKGLTTFGDSLQQKLAAVFSKKPAVKEDEEAGRVEDEDALSDIIRNLVTNDPKKKDRPSALVVKMRENDLNVLTELNRTGRIDYCLPTGVFDISLVSAISAHVSYFEDQNTAGFIMKEVLTSKEHCTETREISVYKKH